MLLVSVDFIMLTSMNISPAYQISLGLFYLHVYETSNPNNIRKKILSLYKLTSCNRNINIKNQKIKTNISTYNNL